MAKQTVELQFLSNAKMMLGELRLVNAEMRNIRLGTDKINASHRKAAGATKKHASAMKGLALRFVGYNLILNQVMGAQQKAIEFVNESVKAYREFESALAEVSTILTMDTLSSIYEFRGGMESLSITFGKVATDLAKATYQILSAAFAADDAMQLLTIATKGAVAGLTDVETSVDVLTSILNAYGQEASQAARMSDYLFQTVIRGKLVYGDYASALGYITPIAANAGVAFKELAAIMSTSTRMGLHLDMTVRGLALMMQGMINPTTQVAKAAKKYNFELGGLQLRIFGLQDMFQKLNAVSKEYGDHVIGELVPNMRATRVAAASAGDEGILGLATDMDYLTNSAGKTEEAMSKITSTTKFMSDQMKQMMEQIKRDFGESLTMPMLEFERVVMGFKAGILGLLGTLGKVPEIGLEDAFPPVTFFKMIGNAVIGFKEGADESNERVRESFNATANFIKNTMLATIEATESEGKKSLFEELIGDDVDVAKILKNADVISDIGDRLDIKEKIAQQVEHMRVALEAAGETFLMQGANADAYATYMKRIFHIQEMNMPQIRELESELLLTENAWNEVTGALASFDEELENLNTNVNLLVIELNSLKDEVGKVGVMYDGTLGVQLKFKEDVADLEDEIRALQNAMKGEETDLDLVSDAMKAHIAKVQAQKDAYKDLTTAMSKNRLEIMKLELIGMTRRRGLLRSEQKMVKKYQIENKEISIEQLSMKLLAEDTASIQHKEILDTELSDLREQLRQMKDTRREDIEDLKTTIIDKETEITKWEGALVEQQLKIEAMTTTHTAFITSLYTNMMDDVLAQFKRFSGYDITQLYKDATPTPTPTPMHEKVTSILPPKVAQTVQRTMFMKLPRTTQNILLEKNPEIRELLNIPIYEKGIDYVPETQLAMVHKGESITPAGENSSSSIHINHLTIDVKEIAELGSVEQLGALLSAAQSSRVLTRGGNTRYKPR